MERLVKIEAQLRLWGLDKLTPTGVKEWTNDIHWLIEQALRVEQLEYEKEQLIFKLGDALIDKHNLAQIEKEHNKTVDNLIKCRKKLKEIKQILNV